MYKCMDFLLKQDIIFVGGGNTKSMLSVWKEWNLDLLGEHSIIRVAVTRYGEGVAALKRPRLAADLASLCIVLKL